MGIKSVTPRAIHSRGGTAPNDHSCGRPAQRIKPSPQSAGWGGDGTRRFLVWGILLRLDWEPLREHVLAGGPARHACRRRRDGTRRFWFGEFFCGWTGSCCGRGG